MSVGLTQPASGRAIRSGYTSQSTIPKTKDELQGIIDNSLQLLPPNPYATISLLKAALVSPPTNLKEEDIFDVLTHLLTKLAEKFPDHYSLKATDLTSWAKRDDRSSTNAALDGLSAFSTLFNQFRSIFFSKAPKKTSENEWLAECFAKLNDKLCQTSGGNRILIQWLAYEIACGSRDTCYKLLEGLSKRDHPPDLTGLWQELQYLNKEKTADFSQEPQKRALQQALSLTMPFVGPDDLNQLKDLCTDAGISVAGAQEAAETTIGIKKLQAILAVKTAFITANTALTKGPTDAEMDQDIDQLQRSDQFPPEAQIRKTLDQLQVQAISTPTDEIKAQIAQCTYLLLLHIRSLEKEVRSKLEQMQRRTDTFISASEREIAVHILGPTTIHIEEIPEGTYHKKEINKSDTDQRNFQSRTQALAQQTQARFMQHKDSKVIGHYYQATRKEYTAKDSEVIGHYYQAIREEYTAVEWHHGDPKSLDSNQFPVNERSLRHICQCIGTELQRSPATIYKRLTTWRVDGKSKTRSLSAHALIGKYGTPEHLYLKKFTEAELKKYCQQMFKLEDSNPQLQYIIDILKPVLIPRDQIRDQAAYIAYVALAQEGTEIPVLLEMARGVIQPEKPADRSAAAASASAADALTAPPLPAAAVAPTPYIIITAALLRARAGITLVDGPDNSVFEAEARTQIDLQRETVKFRQALETLRKQGIQITRLKKSFEELLDTRVLGCDTALNQELSQLQSYISKLEQETEEAKLFDTNILKYILPGSLPELRSRTAHLKEVATYTEKFDALAKKIAQRLEAKKQDIETLTADAPLRDTARKLSGGVTAMAAEADDELALELTAPTPAAAFEAPLITLREAYELAQLDQAQPQEEPSAPISQPKPAEAAPTDAPSRTPQLTPGTVGSAVTDYPSACRKIEYYLQVAQDSRRMKNLSPDQVIAFSALSLFSGSVVPKQVLRKDTTFQAIQYLLERIEQSATTPPATIPQEVFKQLSFLLTRFQQAFNIQPEEMAHLFTTLSHDNPLLLQWLAYEMIFGKTTFAPMILKELHPPVTDSTLAQASPLPSVLSGLWQRLLVQLRTGPLTGKEIETLTKNIAFLGKFAIEPDDFQTVLSLYQQIGARDFGVFVTQANRRKEEFLSQFTTLQKKAGLSIPPSNEMMERDIKRLKRLQEFSTVKELLEALEKLPAPSASPADPTANVQRARLRYLLLLHAHDNHREALKAQARATGQPLPADTPLPKGTITPYVEIKAHLKPTVISSPTTPTDQQVKPSLSTQEVMKTAMELKEQTALSKYQERIAEVNAPKISEAHAKALGNLETLWEIEIPASVLEVSPTTLGRNIETFIVHLQNLRDGIARLKALPATTQLRSQDVITLNQWLKSLKKSYEAITPLWTQIETEAKRLAGTVTAQKTFRKEDTPEPRSVKIGVFYMYHMENMLKESIDSAEDTIQNREAIPKIQQTLQDHMSFASGKRAALAQSNKVLLHTQKQLTDLTLEQGRLNTKKAEIEANIRGLTEAIDTAKIELAKKDRITKQKQDLETNLSELTKQKRLAELARRINQRQLDALVTASREITRTLVENQRALDAKQTNKSELEKSIRSLTDQRSQETTKLTEIPTRLTRLELEVQDVERQLQKTRADLDTKQRELAEYTQAGAAAATQEASELDQLKQRLKQEIRVLEYWLTQLAADTSHAETAPPSPPPPTTAGFTRIRSDASIDQPDSPKPVQSSDVYIKPKNTNDGVAKRLIQEMLDRLRKTLGSDTNTDTSAGTADLPPAPDTTDKLRQKLQELEDLHQRMIRKIEEAATRKETPDSTRDRLAQAVTDTTTRREYLSLSHLTKLAEIAELKRRDLGLSASISRISEKITLSQEAHQQNQQEIAAATKEKRRLRVVSVARSIKIDEINRALRDINKAISQATETIEAIQPVLQRNQDQLTAIAQYEEEDYIPSREVSRRGKTAELTEVIQRLLEIADQIPKQEQIDDMKSTQKRGEAELTKLDKTIQDLESTQRTLQSEVTNQAPFTTTSLATFTNCVRKVQERISTLLQTSNNKGFQQVCTAFLWLQKLATTPLPSTPLLDQEIDRKSEGQLERNLIKLRDKLSGTAAASAAATTNINPIEEEIEKEIEENRQKIAELIHEEDRKKGRLGTQYDEDAFRETYGLLIQKHQRLLRQKELAKATREQTDTEPDSRRRATSISSTSSK